MKMTATDIIPANSIDYQNVREVCAYRLLLCKIYECEGGLNLPPKSTPLTREISRQAKIWLLEVKSLMENILTSPLTKSIPNSERIPNSSFLIPNSISSDKSIPNSSFLIPNLYSIPDLLDGYDMLHRIARGVACHDFIREVRLRTADRWLKGDKSISSTEVAIMLITETNRDIRTLEERYAKYSMGVMASWVDRLLRNGKFSDIPLSESYMILSLLLDTNLSAFTGSRDQLKIKCRWIDSHFLDEQQIDTLDIRTLWAYSHFLNSIPFSSQQEYERNNSLYMDVLSKIAMHPDTHPYAAMAIRLTFSRLNEFIA
ncbi:MAG: hypothetical protein NC095_06830 [Muribaculum sp.]|nr:hypothetical protein [Muribaculum sp.]